MFVPLSPRGAKARRGTSMRREKGCAEYSNRWDESSVLVRYALLFSCDVPFSLILYCSCFPLSSIYICPTFSIFYVTFSSLLICQFRFYFSLFLRPCFCVCLLLPLSLLFPLCLVLDMLPKTTSTPCFPLLTLECKRQRGRERAAKIDSLQ